MLCLAARLTLAAVAAVSMLPASTAMAAPDPKPHLSQVLAEPPTTSYVELASHTPGILEGPFDAGTYASIGGIDMQSTINTLAKDGFISGFGRAWVQQSPSRVMVEIVVAFTGGDGAKQWLQQSQDADMTDPTFQHSITVDGIETYYGARMSDSSSYFADAFLFVKGNDGFLVSTISGFDDLGDDRQRCRPRAACDGVARGRCGGVVARADRRPPSPSVADRMRASGLERPVVLSVEVPVLA